MRAVIITILHVSSGRSNAEAILQTKTTVRTTGDGNLGYINYSYRSLPHIDIYIGAIFIQ